MKKLLLLTAFLFFVGCEENTPDSPTASKSSQQIDYSGLWRGYADEGGDVMFKVNSDNIIYWMWFDTETLACDPGIHDTVKVAIVDNGFEFFGGHPTIPIRRLFLYGTFVDSAFCMGTYQYFSGHAHWVAAVADSMPY